MKQKKKKRVKNALREGISEQNKHKTKEGDMRYGMLKTWMG